MTQPTHRYCSGCLWRTRALNRCYVPLRYEQPLQTLLQRWKFEPAPALSHVLAQLFTQSSVNNSPERPDVLVPVPLHWRRQWQRGFNQCDLLARALQRSCPTADGVPLCNNVIRRVRDTPPQRSLDADARRHNLTGAFALRRRALEGLHVALVDDVMTTGATAEALAQTLLQGGARRVDLWAIARTP